MKVLHRIGPRINSNFNTLEEILACNEPLSFDGVYESVYQNYRALKGKDITFFVIGKYVGADNSFDHGQPHATFCTWPQIEEMAQYLGAKIGYHGWEHKKCVGLSAGELIRELIPPDNVRQILAWPHGVCDGMAIRLAESSGFVEAFCAGANGDGSQFQRHRSYLNW